MAIFPDIQKFQNDKNMKKSILLLSLLFIVLGCPKIDDNSVENGSAGRKVRSICYNTPDESYEYEFKYDKSGHLSGISTFFDGYEELRLTYTYGNDEIQIIDLCENDYPVLYKINSRGLVNSKIVQSDDSSPEELFFYNPEGRIIERNNLDWGETYTYSWKDGNMVGISIREGEHEYAFTFDYTQYTDKSNLDIMSVVHYTHLGTVTPIHLIDKSMFTAFASRNLPANFYAADGNVYKFTYQFDSLGYLTDIYMNVEDEPVEIKIKYN